MDMARTYRNPLSVEWAMTYWYMQGVRNFKVTSWRDGRFKWSYETPQGESRIKVEDTLKQYQRQLGLMQKINFMPATSPKGLGLLSMRKAAVAQVALDALVNSCNMKKLHMDACQLSLMYGAGAFVSSVNPDVSLLGVRPRITLAAPWQILTDPARPMRREEVTGLFYHRWVPYRWAKETFKDRLKFPGSEEEPLLRCRCLSLGERAEASDLEDSVSGSVGRGIGTYQAPLGSEGRAELEEEPWVEIAEYWNYNDYDRVEDYEVMLGDWIATKDSFVTSPNKDMPCLPIGVFNCQASGSFYSRGWVPLMVPVNMSVENMYSTLFKNVQEMDDFNWLLLPNTSGVRDEDLQAKGRPKRIRYEPEYTAPQIKPEMMHFQNSGDFPGRVAGSAIQLLDRLGNASDLFNGKAPGRVDSASGLGLLYETVGIQTIPAASSFNHAYTTIYKSMLQQAGRLLEGRSTLPLLSLDDNLAGVMLDPKTGEMYFDDRNPLPTPDEVNISIRDEQPKMQEQQRQDLMAMKQSGQIDQIDFAWYNYKNNLGLPAGFEVEIEEIRKCMYRNILQWNDGQNPGGVMPSSLDMHALQLKWMKRFMAQPIFGFGSAEVRDAFEQRFNFHQQALGGFPEGLPMPEELGAAADRMQNPDQWGSAGPQGQLPPQLMKMMQQAAQEGADAGPPGQEAPSGPPGQGPPPNLPGE